MKFSEEEMRSIAARCGCSVERVREIGETNEWEVTADDVLRIVERNRKDDEFFGGVEEAIKDGLEPALEDVEEYHSGVVIVFGNKMPDDASMRRYSMTGIARDTDDAKEYSSWIMDVIRDALWAAFRAKNKQKEEEERNGGK